MGKPPRVTEVVQRAIADSVDRLVVHETGVLHDDDVTAVHQARVATRRLRSDLHTFRDLLQDGPVQELRAELRWLGAELGAVRDLDVLIEAGEDYQKKLPSADRPAFEPLLAKWRAQRDAARVVLIKELDSERYLNWVDEYIAFVQAEGIGVRSVGPVEPHRVRDTMPSRIWAAYELSLIHI